MSERNLLGEWAALLVDSFAKAGVREVVISPGSRSTPFVLAFAAHPLVRCHDIVDERSAAFFALGMAKATGAPTLLLCTSGSAGAHYFPAVIEASLSYAPLLVLTADRPFELQDCAAPQTIDQTRLFGDHTRCFVELGMPDGAIGSLRALRRRIAQAVHSSRFPRPGAVHLNARARKPLEPQPAVSDEEHALHERVVRLIASPAPRAFAPRLASDAEGMDTLVEACLVARRGLIVCGPAALSQVDAREAVAAFACASGFPLLAEATSQLRFSVENQRSTIVLCDAFDTLLQSRAFRESEAPDLIVQLGAPPTSRGYELLVEANPECPRHVIAPHGWPDPQSTASSLHVAEVGGAARELADRLVERRAGSRVEPSAWQSRHVQGNALAWRAVEEVLEEGGPLSEGRAVRSVVQSVPSGALLGIGNSLPIREVDTFCSSESAVCAVWSQRGANGIDGLISGAAGAARTGRATTLVIGDVSFLHDLGGLAAARGLAVPFVIAVLQNGGGRIFEQLPLASAPSLAAEISHFTTPHSLSFESVAHMFGHRYSRVQTRSSLESSLAEAQRTVGCSVIEIIVPPHGAAEMARSLGARVDAAVAVAAKGVAPS